MGLLPRLRARLIVETRSAQLGARLQCAQNLRLILHSAENLNLLELEAFTFQLREDVGAAGKRANEFADVTAELLAGDQ